MYLVPKTLLSSIHASACCPQYRNFPISRLDVMLIGWLIVYALQSCEHFGMHRQSWADCHLFQWKHMTICPSTAVVTWLTITCHCSQSPPLGIRTYVHTYVDVLCTCTGLAEGQTVTHKDRHFYTNRPYHWLWPTAQWLLSWHSIVLHIRQPILPN